MFVGCVHDRNVEMHVLVVYGCYYPAWVCVVHVDVLWLEGVVVVVVRYGC